MKTAHPLLFGKYATKTLNSALQNMWRTLQSKINARVARGQQVLNNYSGGLQTLDESTSYVLAEVSKYVPRALAKEEDTIADAVSLLSMDNDYITAGSHTSCFKSGIAGRSQAARDNFLSPSKKKKSYYGNTTMALPFLLDEWDDSMGRPRISVQIHVLSGVDSVN
eukprot:412671-Ditylum_brightwellii.AAC.1